VVPSCRSRSKPTRGRTLTSANLPAAGLSLRYPPLGERFWGPFFAPPRWDVSMRDYLDRADDEVLAIGTIEHIDAVQTIGEVVATPGLDLVFIGPARGYRALVVGFDWSLLQRGIAAAIAGVAR